MGRLIRHKAKAFALIETIVALVIILVFFGLATTIVVQTGRHNISLKQLRATDILQAYADQTQRAKAFFSATEDIESFWVRREVAAYPDYDSVLRIHYFIYDLDRKLLDDWQLLTPGGE